MSDITMTDTDRAVNQTKGREEMGRNSIKKSYTDTDLINFLENKNKEKIYTGRCIFRISPTGRGWRLHETDIKDAKTSVREVIVDAMIKEKI